MRAIVSGEKKQDQRRARRGDPVMMEQGRERSANRAAKVPTKKCRFDGHRPGLITAVICPTPV